MTRSKFVLVEHKAKRAGKHQDFRVKKPASRMWASWALRKGFPENPGEKVLAIRTEDHSEKGALITGEITSGYGKGFITALDGGDCYIDIWTDKHIRLDLKGKKYKGIYHLIQPKGFDKKSWLVFKGK